MRRFPALMILLFFAPAFVGCEESERDPVVVPDTQPGSGPMSRPPNAVPLSVPEGQSDTVPVERPATDVDVSVDRGPNADGGEPREERRDRLRDALDDVNVDVDAEGTDVRIGDGQVDVDSEST